MINMKNTEIYNQVSNYIEQQNERRKSGLPPSDQPDFVRQWRKQAKSELEKITRERKSDPWTASQKSKILELARRGAKIPLAYVISRSEADAYIEEVSAQLAAADEHSKRQRDTVARYSKPAVEAVCDPAKYTGTRDPKAQTEILNREIRALARAGIIGGIPMQKWRNMSPEERLDIILSVPEDERKNVLQNIQSDQNRRFSGRRMRNPGQGPEL